MFGSVANSFVSVVLLIVVSRFLSEADAGIFTLAFSTAQMMYTLALFEVRNIQVTDTKGEFSFADCVTFRSLTVLFMILFATGFSILRGFSGVKLAAVLLLCGYMALLAVSEVFQANLHKNGYLSLAGLSLGCEVTVAAVAFSVALVLTKNLLLSILPMLFVVFAWTVFFDLPFSANFAKPKFVFDFKKLKKLFAYTAPLIISVFLNQYSLNCPKYAIDKYLTEVDQSHYGYLVMPAFCINLLSMFVFRPKIVSLSRDWADKAYKKFNKTAFLLYGWVVIATALVLGGGYLLGIPVLNLLYNTHLDEYRNLFMILLLGGGFSAGSSLCIMLVAVTRKQNYAIFGYLVSAAVALILPDLLVKHTGFAGAPVSYLIQNIVLFASLFGVLYVTAFSKAERVKQ